MAEARLINAPFVAEAHAALECKVTELFQPKTLDGQDSGVVAGPESDISHRATCEFGALGDDDFVESCIRSVSRACDVWKFSALQPWRLEKVDDIVDVPGEVAHVAWAEHCLGTCGDESAGSFDSGEEHPVQRTESGVGHGATGHFAAGFDTHGERVRAL